MKPSEPYLYVALLRGINVGGNTLIKMSELKACFEKAGFGEVKTYINSGNVFFTAQDSNARKIEKLVERVILEQFGHDIKVVARNKQQIENTVGSIPDHWKSNPSLRSNVIFLRHEIDNEEILKSFTPKPNIDEVIYVPGALLWAASTSHLTKSSMMKLSTKPMYKFMTVRNLNTTYKIHEIMSEKMYSDRP